MNNQEFVKLTIEVKTLQEENKTLKQRINQIYDSWLYDSSRYQELKDKYNSLLIKTKITYDC